MMVKQLIVRSMTVTGVVVASLLANAAIGEQAKLLTAEEARTVVEHIPAFLKAASEKRCPKAEQLWASEAVVAFQVRSHCVPSASGLIGNYRVDLKTGEVREGFEGDGTVDSEELRKLRGRLLKTNRESGARKGKDAVSRK
jgi:hypothetical protein